MIRSLLSYPCKLGVKAIISTLRNKIKDDIEAEVYREYMARCARMITENTAYFGSGRYMTIDYRDIIEKKPKEHHEPGKITEKIRSKLR